MPAHYVLVGTFTKDMIADGYTLGGTVFYSGVQAKRLGVDVSVVSTAQADLNLAGYEAGIRVHIQPSSETTTFKNVYDADGNRVQYLSAKSDPLRLDQAPVLTPPPDILHLAPLADEVPIHYGEAYPNAKIAVTPQGWMRKFGSNGRVYPTLWETADQLLPQAWAVVYSEEDLGYDENQIAYLGQLCPIAVCTRNFSAATLFVKGQRSEVPTYPAHIVDPTGAGDVFAAAFFIWLHETNDPEAAVKFAHIAAAQSIEGRGVLNVLNREQILALYR